MFKWYKVWIEGTLPLLQNRFNEAAQQSVPGGSGKRVTSTSPSAHEGPREDAERSCYRNGKGELYFPGAAIARLMREQGSSMKAKGSRKSLKYIVPAAVIVLDEMVTLFAKDRTTALTFFEVDSRRVVIPATKGAVMRHRARINEWSAAFTLRVNTSILDERIVRELVSGGGSCLGIGDFRPEKGGNFGLFDLVSWAEMDRQTESLRQPS